MARNGMRAAGYRYVILDDGWQGRRTAAGPDHRRSRPIPLRHPAARGVRARRGLPASASTPARPRARARPHRQRRARRRRRPHVRQLGRRLRQARLVQRRTTHRRSPPRSRGQWRAALDATHRPMILSASTPAGPRPSARGRTDREQLAGRRRHLRQLVQPDQAAVRRLPGAATTGVYHEGIFDYLTSPGVCRRRRRWPAPATTSTPTCWRWAPPASPPAGRTSPRTRWTRPRPATNFAIWAMWSAPLIAGNDPRSDGRNRSRQPDPAQPADHRHRPGSARPSGEPGPGRRLTGRSGASRWPVAGPRSPW